MNTKNTSKNKIIVLVMMLTLVYSINLAYAACVVPYENMEITTDTTFCSGTYTLNYAGDQNIRITGNNIVVQCNNTIIQGDYATHFTGGIAISGDNVTLKNCDIRGYSDCVSLTNYLQAPARMMENSNIIYNNFTRCDGLAGVFVDGQENFNISNNRFVNFGDYFERDIGSHAIYISGFNQFQSPQSGRVYNNYISNISSSAIKLNSQGTIRNILIYNNKVNAIYASQCDDWGVHLADVQYISIYNNNFIGWYDVGIALEKSEYADKYPNNNNIYNNTFSGLGSALFLASGTYNNYFYNNIYTNNNEDFQIESLANFNAYETNSIKIGNGWDSYLLYLNFTGNKNFTINSYNFNIRNGLSQWSPYDDIKSVSNGALLASNVDSYSYVLVPNQPIVVGNFVADTNPPVNTPPTISASLSSSLNCSTSTYDADGDPLSVSIQWYVNGSLIRTVNKTSDKLANATGIYYCKAQAYDGKDYSSWATSNTVTIASLTHLPPLATVALTSTDSTTNSDLNCDYTVSGRNNVTINTRLLWYKNSVLAISNGQSTLGKGNLTIGDVWYCQVNVSDIYNTTIANSNSLTILASPNPAATITYINLSGNISKLNCSGKYSDNNATLSATIKFIKDNVLMNTSTITASNNTFFSATQVGAVGTWKCNISVETTTSTSNSIIITQTYHPPSINVTLTNISNNLSCNYNVADAGSDATAVVKWYKNNSLFTTGPTTITNASAGSWYCQITATDTYNTTLANSNTITITLPIYLAPLVSIALTSADSTINSDLNCVNTITGRNSVAVNSKISWYKNNALIISNGQQILGKSNLTVGDVWYCKINATDAYNTTIVNSNTITISDVAQAPIVIPPSNSGGSSGSSYYPITDTTTTVDNTSNSSESITIPSTTSTTPSTIESPSNIDSQVNTSDNSTLSNNVNDVKTKPNMEQPKNIKKNLSVNAVANNVVPYIMVTIFITSLSLLIFSKKRVAATAKIVPNILSPLKIKIAPSIISNVKAAYNLKDKILQYIDSGKVTAETLTRLIRGYANNGMLTPVEVRELHTHLRR